MKPISVLIAVCLVYTAVCQSCKDTMHCTEKCPDGYHSQCINMMCKCPSHSCSDTVKCPQGNASGCPSFCTTMCQDGRCICKWPGEY